MQSREETIRQVIQAGLKTLKAKNFLDALVDGGESYYKYDATSFKSNYTMGLDSSWRSIKFFFRTHFSFSETSVNDANVRDRLSQFLSGTGNDDLLSLKYNVVKQLFFPIWADVTSDETAKNLIRIVLEELGVPRISQNSQEIPLSDRNNTPMS